jgi:putative aldouronate transport system permease protein
LVQKSDRKFQILSNIIMMLGTLITVLPFALLIISSFTKNTDITLYGYTFIPKQWSLDAYSYIYRERKQIFNAYITVLVTTVGTAIGLLMSILYAYVLSKPHFPGKRFFSLFLFFTMLFNGGLVPTYIMYTQFFHIKNTVFALIIPSLLMGAFNVILIRSYLQNNIPQALTEAAFIDGASEYQIVYKIVFPMAKPIIATIGLFIGLAYWNDWMNGLYYVTNTNLFSIQQLLTNMMRNIEYLSKNANTNINLSNIANGIPQATVRMAIAVIGILPILIVYPFVQKYFVKGISLGAVKG